MKVYLCKDHKSLNKIFTDYWRSVTNVPTGRKFPGVAAVNNKIYVTGGWETDGQPMASVQCYDPEANTWSEVADMTSPRNGHALVSLDGRLYAIGGQDVDSVEVYDPANNTWTLLQHKLEGDVFNTGCCLIKKYYVL